MFGSVSLFNIAYLQQLFADMGYSIEDLLEAIDNKEEWRESEHQGNPYKRHDTMIYIYRERERKRVRVRESIYIYIYIYIYILKSAYLGCKLLFKQVLLKTMEPFLSFLIVIFHVLLLLLYQDPGAKEIDPYLLSKRFRP